VSHSYARLYYHLVWATVQRQPLLMPEIEEDVHRFIRGKCGEMRAMVLAVNGTVDHVHLLVQLPTSLAVDVLMQRVKGASSRFVTQRFGMEQFRWQGGYGAFTLHSALVPRVQSYIDGQKEHHQSGTLIPSLEWCAEEDRPFSEKQDGDNGSPRSGLSVSSPKFTRGPFTREHQDGPRL
jgi:REP element-mobilizing transposase RayT